MISYFKIPVHVEERSVFRYRRSYIENTNLGPRCNTVLPGDLYSPCFHRKFLYPAFCTAGLHSQTPKITTACQAKMHAVCTIFMIVLV